MNTESYAKILSLKQFSEDILHEKDYSHNYMDEAGSIHSIAFHPNGKFIIIIVHYERWKYHHGENGGPYDDGRKIYDVFYLSKTAISNLIQNKSDIINKEIYTCYKGQVNNEIICIVNSDDLVLFGADEHIFKDEEGKILLYDIASSKETEIFRLNCEITSMCASSSCKFLALGDSKGNITILDVDTKSTTFCKFVGIFKGHSDDINCIDYSPDGKYLASGSNDKSIKIWNTDPNSPNFGKCLYTIKHQLSCEGMNIFGTKGLNEDQIKFLKERGAVEIDPFSNEV